MSVQSNLRALQAVIDPTRSYWKVVLTNGKELSEHKLVLDLRRGGYRALDWALDLVSTGDVKRIKELWLHCPNGQYAMVTITEPGTALQFSHKSHDFFGGAGSNIEAQGIGKVTNKETGECECVIWDREKGLIPYNSNIREFGMWRPNSGLMPVKAFDADVMGLRLG